MSKEKADKISPRGSDAVAFLSEICTPAEIEAADMKARLVAFRLTMSRKPLETEGF